ILIELLLPLALTIFRVYHGVLQVLYHAGVIQNTDFLGIDYYQGLTAHGVINAIVLTTFFAVAFGNAVVSQLLDRAVALRGAWIGLTLMVGGTLVAAFPIFTGKANVLYTFYAPLKAHPLVYFWLLPTYVMYYMTLPRLAGGKLYSDFYGRFAFLAFIVLSAPLGLHHQFTEPALSSGYKFLHAALTFLVAVPSFATAFT